MFLLILFLCFKAVSTDIQIIPGDGSKVLQKGSKYHITCTSKNLPATELYWVDNFARRVIYNDPANSSTVYYTQSKDKTVLNFASASFEDEGLYKCMHANKQESTYYLYVYEPIKFLSPKTQYLRLGASNDTVECEISAYPHPSILSWSHNGKELSYGSKYKEVRGKSLHVVDVRKSDGGDYVCVASLEPVYKHSQSFSIKVHIKRAPKIEGWPGKEVVREDTDLSLQCKVDVEACPYNVTFSLNNKVLEASKRVSLSRDGCRNGGVNSVFISSTLREDEGVWRCRVDNQVGSDEKAVDLSVVVTPKILSFNDTSCLKGKKCLLQCVYEGDVVANITHEGQTISSVTEVKDGETTLRVYADKPGKHVCLVSSEFGKDVAEAYVTIMFKPSALEDQVKEVFSWEGQVRNITCRVKSNPAPEIDWIVRKKTVKESTDYHNILQQHPTVSEGNDVYSSVLTVKYTDHRWYTLFNPMLCSAVNKAGATNITIKITRAMIPGQPDVHIERIFAGEVWLVAQPAPFTGLIPLRGVHVEVFNERGLSINAFNFTLDEKVRVTGLEKLTAYKLKVTTFNDKGLSEIREVSVTTGEATKPEPVTLVSGDISNKPWYEVKWGSPVQVGSPVLHVVKHRKVAGHSALKEPLEDWIRHNTTAHHYNITNLPPNCTIQIEVMAVNSLGKADDHEDFYVSIDYAVVGVPKVDSALSYAASTHSGASTHQSQTRIALICFLTIILLMVVFAFLIDATCYYQRGTSLFYHRIISSRQPNKVSHKIDEQSLQQEAEKNNLINHHKNDNSISNNNNNLNNNNDKSLIISSYSTSTYRSENVTSTPRDTSVDCGTFDGSVRS